MQIEQCMNSIVEWFRKEVQLSLDDLVFEGLIEYSQDEILKSLLWLAEQKLIYCPDTLQELPFIQVPGGIEFSEKKWSLTELAQSTHLNFHAVRFS